MQIKKNSSETTGQKFKYEHRMNAIPNYRHEITRDCMAWH